MVASSSAFISTTDLPWAKACRTTCAPNSTDPVTSTTMSISPDWQISDASSATAGLPSRTAWSSAACVETVTGSQRA